MGKALPGRQPFYAHLAELRTRALTVALSLIAGGVVGYYWREPVKHFLIKPLGQTLYYSSPTGGFDFIFRICLFFGLLFAIPVLIYQLVRFVEPVLARRGRGLIFKLVLASIFLSGAGFAFAYYVSLPGALKFLSTFSDGSIQALISTDQYFNFVMAYLIGFVLLFQLPLLLILIHKVTPLDPGGLMKNQRLVIVASFIVAAVLTPTPDPMNQALMAAPMIGLYQISVGGVWATRRGERRRLLKWQGVVRVPSAKEFELMQQHLWQLQQMVAAAAPQLASRQVQAMGQVLDLRSYAVALDEPEHKPSANILDLRSTQSV